MSVLYAPVAVRPALFALHGLDLEMAAVVAGTTDPMIGEIRLAWWREALHGLDAGKVPAQPLLAQVAAELLPRGVSGAALADIEDRWLPLIGNDAVPPAHVTGGGLVFALAARLLGTDEPMARRLGEAWAVGDDLVSGVPTPLRPLRGLVRLAARDAARSRARLPREVRGSLARQWLLLKTIAFG